MHRDLRDIAGRGDNTICHVAAAVLGAAAIGAVATTSAAGSAADASQQASNQSIAAQQANLAQIRQDEAPYLQGGYTALNALTSRLGLPPQSVTQAPSYVAGGTPAAPGYPGGSAGYPSAPTSAAPGGPGPNGYTDAAVETLGSTPAAKTGASTLPPASDPSGAAVDPSAGSPIPYTAPANANPGTVGAPGAAPTVNALTSTPIANPDPGTFGNGSNPQYSAPANTPATPAFQNPEQQPANFTNTETSPAPYTNSLTAPSYTAPAPFSYTASDYTASPAYNYQLQQALQGTEATAAATGSLQSGAAAKALQDRAENVALTDFDNERTAAQGIYDDNANRGLATYQTLTGAEQAQQGLNLNAYNTNLGAYQNNRNFDFANYQQQQANYQNNRNFDYQDYTDAANRNIANFDTDRAFDQGAYQDARNYLTGQYNTQTGNLFNLTNLGQSAASLQAQAGTSATNGIVNSLTGNAANQANASIAGANATTGLLGSGVNALAYSNAFRGPTTAATTSYPQSNPGSTLGTVNLGF